MEEIETFSSQAQDITWFAYSSSYHVLGFEPSIQEDLDFYTEITLIGHEVEGRSCDLHHSNIGKQRSERRAKLIVRVNFG